MTTTAFGAAPQGASALVRVPVAAVWRDPDLVRPRDALARRDEPDTAAWRAAVEGQAHHDLIGRADTQALLGEPVIVLDGHDGRPEGWTKVILPWQPSHLDQAGYPGWVRSAHLAPLPTGWLPEATVASARLVTAASADGPVVLSMGTRLPIVATREASVVLRHPDGRELTVDAAALVAPTEPTATGAAGSAPARFTSAGSEPPTIELARLFLDLPYFWAGICGHGVDCSGLVHLTARTVGVTVPRDADDQAAAAEPVALPELRAGDAVFFTNESDGLHHVGLAIDGERMIHSPNCDRVVSIDLIAEHAGTSETVTAGRFLELPAA